MKEKFFKIAREESFKSNYQHKIGAILVSGSRILSKGYNQIRHLKIGKRYTAFDCSLHAERDCVSKLDKSSVKGADIYIYRETKDGFPALSLPCSQCMFMLHELGIHRIFYTTSEFPFYCKIKLT
jgi:deoxycytidylate deaminase